MFALKKFVASWLMPLPLAVLLVLAGLILCFRTKRQKAGRRLAIAGIGLLMVFSNRKVCQMLLCPLEDAYPAIQGPADPRIGGCRYIVVLGGGNANAPGLPAASRLSTPSLGRIVEAARLARMLPDAKLIVSGPSVDGGPTHASVLAGAARDLGIDPGRILLIETARDTAEEAAAVHALVGREKVALVTSAWHMPRAAALFSKAEVSFVPCPADFLAKNHGWSLLADWDIESLEGSTRAVHEWIGGLWERIIGKA